MSQGQQRLALSIAVTRTLNVLRRQYLEEALVGSELIHAVESSLGTTFGAMEVSISAGQLTLTECTTAPGVGVLDEPVTLSLPVGPLWWDWWQEYTERGDSNAEYDELNSETEDSYYEDGDDFLESLDADRG
jgi:hypothetical protein